MILSTTSQLQLLLYNILAGVLTGVLFDVYRTIRGTCNNKIILFIQDILFWIFAAIVVFIFLFTTNYAYMGVQCYMYIAFGIFAYLKLFSRYFYKSINKINKAMGKIIRVTFNIFTYTIGCFFHIFFKKEKKNKKYKNNLNKK
ncbi:spore cortex biosynthesis protein YabQ [Haloimpatiens lingqiaonensis]|uniref:spore cortex biosynthesis protein YabQ n=1 Tax=Haloimpatiens lingqiaonensis TaxID=1380675 RepID=UPI0010FE4286|nr:spore cortex biosynthesis protein YabQ [Haloimpatiens lingqiaonensis]